MSEHAIALKNIIETLNLQVACGEEFLDKEVEGGYVSDLLSDVMANVKKNSIWITIQTHPNIVAVAVLKMLSGILLAGGQQPEEATIEKAMTKNVAILTSPLPAFELAGKLYEIGVHHRD